MNEYRITLKHDTGKKTFRVYSNSEAEAMEYICNAENCPNSAIVKIQLIPYFVTMTDKFMSGWGMAQGKTNKFIVVCENYAQALTIERNAQKRNEMKYINICTSKPRYGRNVVESWRHFAELGEIWKQK